MFYLTIFILINLILVKLLMPVVLYRNEIKCLFQGETGIAGDPGEDGFLGRKVSSNAEGYLWLMSCSC